jgi:hypothetical protein
MMSLFVEVTDNDKNCPIIINLDHVVQIAPLKTGGCALFVVEGGGVNAKGDVRVKEDYSVFKQFAMQTVTTEDIARRFPKVTDKPLGEPREFVKQEDELEIPTIGKPKVTKK